MSEVHQPNIDKANFNEMRARYGMDEVEEKKVRQWNKHRCKKWEEKLINEARDEAAKRGEEIDVLDPKFDVCPAMTREVKKVARERGREGSRTRERRANGGE